MHRFTVILLGVLTSVAWLLPVVVEAKLVANHNETLLDDE